MNDTTKGIGVAAVIVCDLHSAVVLAWAALADLIETRERIARRLRRDEADFSLTQSF